MTEWTREVVAARLDSAADVLGPSLGLKPQGCLDAWLEHVHSLGETGGRNLETRVLDPGHCALDEAAAALLWLRWLQPRDARLVWLRANGVAWKAICWECGVSRATANRRRAHGLSVIAWRLNGGQGRHQERRP